MQEPIDRIRRLMRERGLRQVDIANATGASKGAVSKWFSGTFSPSSEYLVKIANILDTTPSYLLTGEGNPTPTAPATTEANLPSLLESSSNSVIDLMDNLRGLEKQGELTPELVSLLNATIDTFKKVKPQTKPVSQVDIAHLQNLADAEAKEDGRDRQSD